ncbi:MAG: Hsp20/alpha crystallin family protein [Cyanobacteriota bacterium]
MFKRLKKVNPLIFIATGLGIVSILFVGLLAGILVFASTSNATNDAFSEKFFVAENQPDTPINLQTNNLNNLNSQSTSKELELMKQIMDQHQRQMNMISNQSISRNSSIFSNNIASGLIDLNLSTPSVVNFDEQPDKYVITIDLKKKNIDENSIIVDLNPNSIDLQIKTTSKNGNSISSSSIRQAMTFNSPIDPSKVKRETKNNKHVIILPKIS